MKNVYLVKKDTSKPIKSTNPKKNKKKPYDQKGFFYFLKVTYKETMLNI